MSAAAETKLPVDRAPAPARADGGIDLAALLAPIPGPNPAGTAVRYAGDYDRIQAARQEDDPSLPQGIWQRQLKRADWDEVAALCAEALSRRSKDLQIAAWLVEAMVQRRGFLALASGFDSFAPSLHSSS